MNKSDVDESSPTQEVTHVIITQEEPTCWVWCKILGYLIRFAVYVIIGYVLLCLILFLLVVFGPALIRLFRVVLLFMLGLFSVHRVPEPFFQGY